MMKRLDAAEMRDLARESWLGDEYKAFNKTYNDLGKKTRRRLRRLGYERDCGIDAEMEYLAYNAYDAHERPTWYIFKNSPKVANDLAKVGLNGLREWQGRNPSPIRPDRRH